MDVEVKDGLPGGGAAGVLQVHAVRGQRRHRPRGEPLGGAHRHRQLVRLDLQQVTRMAARDDERMTAGRGTDIHERDRVRVLIDSLGGQLAALTRHHLALGFLVHRTPLSRRDVYDYLTTCAPVGVDVTVLSVADRLATRGRNAQRAIARHCELAGEMLGETLAYERRPPRPPLRGDELAAALGIPPGPQLGRVLAELTAATFSGEVRDREQALSLARSLVDADGSPRV
jgi:hypothetical protein